MQSTMLGQAGKLAYRLQSPLPRVGSSTYSIDTRRTYPSTSSNSKSKSSSTSCWSERIRTGLPIKACGRTVARARTGASRVSMHHDAYASLIDPHSGLWLSANSDSGLRQHPIDSDDQGGTPYVLSWALGCCSTLELRLVTRTS